ncbi:MAG: hypothetical protein SVM80_13770, partial [Halobacteriota archaeon]|nr:hypothetical protein [Halobacteriota archaeon]
MDINDINEKDILIHSPELLTRRVYGYRISDPHQNILDHIDAHQSTLDLAPRGIGKTRVLTIGWVTWKVINNPDLRILIVSDTDGHAVRFLKTIKTALEVSDTIKNYYGDLRGDTWTDHEITLSGRSKIFTEATITAHGMYSGAVTSGHYDIIIADDLINFDNSRTEGQRERAKDWFKTTLLPTLLTDGEIHVLGTRYNPQDLYQFVIDELGYDVQIQRAIGEDGTSICEWLLPLNDKIINGKIHEGLTTKREKLGSIIFDLQYQNDVELMKTGKIFKYSYFQFYDELPSTSAVYMGIDPAISKKSTADYFALCAIGIVGTDIYILDAYR